MHMTLNCKTFTDSYVLRTDTESNFEFSSETRINIYYNMEPLLINPEYYLNEGTQKKGAILPLKYRSVSFVFSKYAVDECIILILFFIIINFIIIPRLHYILLRISTPFHRRSIFN